MPPDEPPPGEETWPTREKRETVVGQPDETVVERTAEIPPGPPGGPPPPGAPFEPPLVPPPEEEPGRGIGYGMLIGIVLLAAAGAAIAALLLLQDDDDNRSTTTGTTTAAIDVPFPAPQVVGSQRDEAVSTLESRGLQVNVEMVPGTPPAGRVIAQDPGAGEQVRQGESVRLNVSDGNQGAATTVATTTVETTTVQTTVQATTAEQPTTTAPAEPEQVQVPQVTGSLKSAVQRLSDSRLVARVQYVPSDEPLGTIVAQTPTAGGSVSTGSEVTVNASDGQGERPQQSVPDTTGQTTQEALQTLKNAGFRMILLRREVDDQSQAGRMVAQTPDAGEQAPENAQIVVYMGAFTG